MMKSKYVLAAVMALGLFPLAARAASERPPVVSVSKPNIVVFLADDMGWGDASCYGSEKIVSPNIDKLATQGVRFTQAYAACGVCSPSRSAILTGRTPYRNGVWEHLSGKGPAHLRASEITYPKLLQQAGYTTCHVGKWHLNSKQQFNNPEFPQPSDHGYDYWMSTHNNASPSHKNPDNFIRNGEPVGPVNAYSAPFVAKEAIHWLKDIRDPAKPFVLSIWVHEPHLPIATDKPFLAHYGKDPEAKYYGNITQLDFALGEVMDELEAQGVADNTLFIFTSDNGPEGSAARGGSTGGLSGRKRDDLEGGIRVPGIVRWPGHIEPGTVSSVPVIGSDIFTTVLEAAGVPIPTDRTIDGASMVPAFSGKPVQRTVPLFWRTHVSGSESRVAVREGDWKLVANDAMDRFQLFNIEQDPEEANNLAGTMPEKLDELKKTMFAVWEDVQSEGPSEWWLEVKRKPKGPNGTLPY